jgi:hypothetical protein
MKIEHDGPKNGDFASYVEALVRREALALRLPAQQPGKGSAPVVPTLAPPTSSTKPANKQASKSASKPTAQPARATPVARPATTAQPEEGLPDVQVLLQRWGRKVLPWLGGLLFLWLMSPLLLPEWDAQERLIASGLVLALIARWWAKVAKDRS